MPQPKHDRCLLCHWSEFGDFKQKDERTGELIGKCCLEAPAVVVLHFQAPTFVMADGANDGAPFSRAGAIEEVVTGAQPVVKASFWCRHFVPADRSELEKMGVKP